jgi:hypothetical protein
LLCIAHHAAPDGTGAYPSVETLSEETKIDTRRVRRLLRELEQSEELGRSTGGGKKANDYTILLPISPGSGTGAPEPLGRGNRGAHARGGLAPAPDQQTVVETSVVALTKSKTTLALELEAIIETPSVAMDLANRYPERIPLQIACLDFRKYRDRKATLIAAIRGNWSPPAAYLKHIEGAKQEVARREEERRQEAKREEERRQEAQQEAEREREGARLDAAYEALNDAEKAAIDAQAMERLGVLGRAGRAQVGLMFMRRTLIKEKEKR